MSSELCDPQVIRAAMAGAPFSKRLGQNFLTDAGVPKRMAGLFGKKHAVLEIGPGFGALTAALAETCGAVVAVEKDKRLLPLLRQNLSPFPNVTLIGGDALRLGLTALMPAGLIPAVCANLPYSLTTPLLVKLLESGSEGIGRALPDTPLPPLHDPVVVMVQREVARRLTAIAGTPEYGAITVFAALRARCSVLFDVPPESFMPRPAVTSTVIRFDRHAPDAARDSLVPAALRLSKAAFAQRRKTLANALSAGLALPRAAVTGRLRGAGFDPGARGETVPPEGYLEMAKAFTDIKMGA
ncbi:MAG: 16S rRNA (adenine(1518)-N(6)/adenine(1519)-N(6))-dimethyltransferase RsmA [Oscillospiraceae bacterium]|jgi:16S rRNA (adenine1518-N6/adenine1519-N6)-dimethyltransferase|nr:16S rRNA (adenine(1518)-N(6)/adenine(1519)-N(6))-dimethyltransferase RsmA [Oscillospiraceae bacterium]